MSWALEEWKDGLPGKALQKIREIEGQLDKLKKERQQKQFQLDTLEAALQKQKQKVDQEKNEAISLKKENQSLVESCHSLEKNRQKVTHDLHVKEQQVNFLEGQLSSSKKLIERLEQENKRYKSELDRTPSSHAVDPQPYSTPQKTFATPITPNYRQHGSKFEDLQDKYSKELEERKRLEAELKVIQVKAVNQSSVSHKDIARQQTQSSIFPWQQEQTPNRQSHTFMDTPLKRSTGNSSFMWEQQEMPLKQSHRNSSTSQSDSASTQAIEQLSATNQDLKLKVSELELRLQAQDKEMKNQMNKLKEIQSQLDNTKRDLCEKDKTLSKSRDELSKMATQYDQAVTKCSAVEQKLKQVTEEMNCQRHNAESSRRALEQKIKDQERESQKELAQVQNAQRALDQQFNQMKTKTSQELQQAKKDNNMLQSDIDKVMAQKGNLERDLEELKQKLWRSEQALQTTQSKEMDLKKKFEEMQREKNGLSCEVEQGTKRATQVEDELKTTKQNLKQSHSMVEDLKAKIQAQSEELKGLQIKMESLSRSFAQDLENLKKTLAQLEAEKGKNQNEITKQKTEIELMANKQSALEKERQDLQQTVDSKQNECVELKKEHESVLSWKSEKESLINNIETERESMLSKIHELEKSQESLGDVQRDLTENMQNLQNEKGRLMGQVDSLKGEILNKCVELEERGRAYEELQKQSEESDRKHSKDLENTVVRVTLLQGKVTELESRLKQETDRVEKAEQSVSEVSSQYESVCDLVKSKDSVLELKENEIANLGDSLAQAVSQQEQQMAKFTEEKCSLIKEYEESLLMQKEEAEQSKLNYEKSQQDVLLLQDQVASLESALKLHKSFGVELQSKHEELSKVKDDLHAKILEAEKSQEDILHEMSVLAAQAKSAVCLQAQCNNLSVEVEENKNALQSMTEALNQKVYELQARERSAEELKMRMTESKTEASNLEKDNLHLKEKLHVLEKEAEVASTNNEGLQQAHNILCGEKAVLLKENAILLTAVVEKEAAVEMSLTLKKEHEALSHLHAELKSSLENLEGKYAVALELNSNLEDSLNEKLNKLSSTEKEIEELTETNRIESEKHVSKMKDHEEREQNLKEGLDLMKTQLENKTNEVSDAKDKFETAEAEIFKLQNEVSAVHDELAEVNDSYKTICQEKEQWKQMASSLQKEVETLGSYLVASKNNLEKHKCEMQSLKRKLQDSELEKVKASDAMKEKVFNMNKIKVQLEMLQMDLEDNEACMNSQESQIEELQGSITTLEIKLEEIEQQKSTVQDELCSVREELALKDSEVSQMRESFEELNHGPTLAFLTSEKECLQEAKEKLQVAFEKEIKNYSNLEKMYFQLMKENSDLDTKFENLKKSGQNVQEERDSLKKKNDSLEMILQNIRGDYESLKSTFEKTAEQNDKANLRNQEFGKEQMELHQKLAHLQNELDTFREQYNHLLSRVSEQQSLIEQLEGEEGIFTKAGYPERRQKRISSIVNISLTNEEDSDLQFTCENISFDSLHGDNLFEAPCADSCVASCKNEADNFEASDDKLESLQVKQEKVVSNSKQLSGDHVDPLSAAEELRRKSTELEDLSHAFEEAVRTLEDQMEAQRQASEIEIGDLKGLLDNAQNNLERLQQQHACEVENWQQKTVSVRLEMDVKLAEERQHCVFLYSELESARLQMRSVDPRSRSLGVDDNECLLQPQKVKEQKPEYLEEVPGFRTSNVWPLADMSNTVKEDTVDTSFLRDDLHDGKAVTQSHAVTAVEKHSDQGQLANLEENKKTVQKLQEELQTLRCQLELFTNETASKKNLCNEMEDKIHKLEAEKSDYIARLNATIQEKQRLGVHLVERQEEVSSLKLQLQTSKCQLSDVMEMLQNLEIAKGNWDDKFFQLENELKRARSEKANLEKHILSMEADLEEMQVKREKLQAELDASRKVGANFEQRLNVATTEGQQLTQELLSCAEEKENVDQTLSEWKVKAEQLEMNSCETRDLIKILEEDIRKGKRESEIASVNLEGLRKEKEQLLQQFQILERTIGLLNGEKEGLLKEVSQFKEEQCTVVRSSESMVSKIQLLEEENSRLSHALESSLLEKGEIASRLNSTQEEVTQMRAGIEKLKVRIEADERKKRHMSELLKATQRKSETLQDSVEKLEREKEMTEQSLEDAILQAETAKAELEDLETEKAELAKTIEQVTAQLGDLRVEKQNLERELVGKNEQLKHLRKSALAATANLERIEKEMEEAERNRESTVENLKSQLSALDGQLQACQSKLESAHFKEQGLAGQVSSLETEKVALSLKLQEAEELQTDLLTVNKSLKEECEAKQQEIRECKENEKRLQQKVAELQTLRQMAEEKLSFIDGEREGLEREKMRLQSSSTEWEQKAQMQSTAGEVMQCTIASLEGSVKQLEDSLKVTKLANAELTEKINTLQDHHVRLQTEMAEAQRNAEEIQGTFEQERLSLTCELQSSQQQAENYKTSLEVFASEKEELRRHLDCALENHTQEMKEKEASHKELLNEAQRQYEVELQTVKEELAAAEGKASKLLNEINILKSSKEELNSLLKEQESKLQFSDKTKVDELNSRVASLLKEKDTALSKLNLWMKSCKQLEEEKRVLLKENEQQGALIPTLENSQKEGDGGRQVEDLQVEITELKEALEDKTREADESVEKYCSLMVSVHKLERANEDLTSRVARLAAASKNEPHDENGQSPSLGKRQRAGLPEEGDVATETQEALHQTSKRIRAGVPPQANAGEDEFRPEGLPELVQKGFADIPMGEMSPFIVRRTTVLRCSPRLAARRSTSNTPDTSILSPKTPAEGSKHQKGTKLCTAPAGNTSGVLAPVGNSPKTRAFESPVASTEGRKGRGPLSTQKTPVQRPNHRQATTPAKQDENCQVQ